MNSIFARADELLSSGATKAPVAQRADRADEISPDYSLDGLNVRSNVPLEKIISAARMFRSGERRPAVDRPRFNILLSGVPGSGKTAFARYLAKEVGTRLKAAKVSDLMSKWIGESEKNLAKVFREAEESDSILLLDECDSFLMSREGADHPWEVSTVNELLQQMEQFSGVMIASTNFIDNLDAASMRRFTFRIELDYLTDEGKEKFFARYFGGRLSAAERRRLEAMDRLCPGDFRTVKERLFYICDNETNEDRLNALQEESDAKKEGHARIGF